MEHSWIIAVLLAALASFISNLGVTLQKLHHIRQAEQELYSRSHPIIPNTPSSLNHSSASASSSSANGHVVTDSAPSSSSSPPPPPLPAQKGYVHAVLWQTGLGLVIFGSIADFAALSFGPQSLVAPLGSLTLVSNAIFAPHLLKESISRHDIGATTLIILGSSISVAFGSHESAVYTVRELFSFYQRPTFVVYALIISIFMLLLFLAIKHIEHIEAEDNTSPAYLRLRGFHRFLYPTISGTVGAQSVLFAKCSVELLANSFAGREFLFSYPQTYIVLGCMFATIFLQIKWLNEGLRRFDATYSVPVFTSFWILLSVISGMIFYKEYTGMSEFGTLMFVIGVLITITGVAALSQRDHRSPASIHLAQQQQSSESRSTSPVPSSTASVLSSAANHARDGVYISVDRSLHQQHYDDDDDLDLDLEDGLTTTEIARMNQHAIHTLREEEQQALSNVSQALKTTTTTTTIPSPIAVQPQSHTQTRLHDTDTDTDQDIHALQSSYSYTNTNGMGNGTINGHGHVRRDVLWEATKGQPYGHVHPHPHHRIPSSSSNSLSHLVDSSSTPDSQSLLRKSSISHAVMS